MDPVTIASLAGGAVDLAGNIFGGFEKSRKQREASRALLAGLNQARDIYGENLEQVQGMYDPYASGGLDAWNRMQGMEGELDPRLFTLPELEDYQYDKDVSDFLDPSMQFQMDEGRRALEASAAASGNLLSGGLLKDLTDYSQGIASQEYGRAYDRMADDRARGYQEYLNKFNTERANIADRYQKVSDKYNRLSGQAGVGQMATGAQAGALQNYGGQMGNLATQEANVHAARAQIPGFWENLTGSGEQLGNIIGQGIEAFTPTPQAGIPQFGTTQTPVGMNTANSAIGQVYQTGSGIDPISAMNLRMGMK